MRCLIRQHLNYWFHTLPKLATTWRPDMVLIVAKRFQWLGVKQPERLVDKSSSTPVLSEAQTKLQQTGVPSTDLTSRSAPKNYNAQQPLASLWEQPFSITTPTISTTPSRQDGITNLDIQAVSSEPWGARVISANIPSKQIPITITPGFELSRGWGGKAIFPQPSPLNVISTVVRDYPEVTRAWGGIAMMPLYWLDLPPDWEPPSGNNNWSVVDESKWPITPIPRFRLYVEGVLQ